MEEIIKILVVEDDEVDRMAVSRAPSRDDISQNRVQLTTKARLMRS